jgi:hypothetical protein
VQEYRRVFTAAILSRPPQGRRYSPCLLRCSLDHKVKLAAGTLYHLISAIPVAERDGNEIYPNEIPVWPKKYMWLPGLGLSDYAGPARLRSRFGRELVIRQKAASPIRNALTHLIGLPAIDTRWALSLLAPETQQVLKRIGRLYKNSCWWSKKGPQRLFDNAQASSWNAQTRD